MKNKELLITLIALVIGVALGWLLATQSASTPTTNEVTQLPSDYITATAGGQGKVQGNSCMSQCMGQQADSYSAGNVLTQACQEECKVGTGAGTCLTTEDDCCVPYTDDVDCGPTVKIAFSSRRETGNDIFVMDINGSHIVNLTENSSYRQNHNPDWSPDGSKIVFQGFAYGNWNLFVMNSNGSNITYLYGGAVTTTPSWSPDGTKIAFAAYINGNYDVYTVNASDGSNLTNVTNNSFTNLWPTWSSDGNQIAFRSNRGGVSGIYTMDADGSNQTLISNSSYPSFHPDWSQDGSNRIAFFSKRNGNDDIYVMNSDGSNEMRLTTDPGHDSHPDWSYDGSKVIFTTTRDENSEVYIIDSDGSNETNLTNYLLRDADAAFSAPF